MTAWGAYVIWATGDPVGHPAFVQASGGLDSTAQSEDRGERGDTSLGWTRTPPASGI